MLDFKIQLKTAYNADAQRRKDNENNRESWKLRCRESFTELLKANNFNTVLELGSGVGLDATYFKSLGFDVLATDLSEDMISSCKEKGLNAEIIDMYELGKLGRVFDGIYSMNVLLHTPRNDLKLVLTSIENALSSKGLFFYGVYGGKDIEKVITDNKKIGLPRFFSFLSDATLQELVSDTFDILKFEAIETGGEEPWFHFQAMYLQKKH